jgi:hypothetical protein
MDERSLLLAKVDALREQLDWAESSLKSARINPRVSQAASIGFKRLFDRRRKELTRLRKSFSKTERVFSTELQRSTNSCAELFNECLGFLGGAMLRDAHKEDDICEIADFLLEDLSRQAGIRWDGVTLLAEAHFFRITASGICQSQLTSSDISSVLVFPMAQETFRFKRSYKVLSRITSRANSQKKKWFERYLICGNFFLISSPCTPWDPHMLAPVSCFVSILTMLWLVRMAIHIPVMPSVFPSFSERSSGLQAIHTGRLLIVYEGYGRRT